MSGLNTDQLRRACLVGVLLTTTLKLRNKTQKSDSYNDKKSLFCLGLLVSKAWVGTTQLASEKTLCMHAPIHASTCIGSSVHICVCVEARGQSPVLLLVKSHRATHYPEVSLIRPGCWTAVIRNYCLCLLSAGITSVHPTNSGPYTCPTSTLLGHLYRPKQGYLYRSIKKEMI